MSDPVFSKELIGVLRNFIVTMEGPDVEHAKYVQSLWDDVWRLALKEVQEFNDRRLMNFLLDSGQHVPADCARALLTLRGPNRRPPAIRETPAQVVYRVRMAIIRGHRFESLEKAEHNPAFVAVARQLHCTPAAVQHHYRRCPAAKRKAIKDNLDKVRRYKAFMREFTRLMHILQDDPAPEVEREARATLRSLIEKRKSGSGGGK